MQETKLINCWACDSLAKAKADSQYSRIEEHHIFGRLHDETVPLCVLCHDLVDRLPLMNLTVMSEFMGAIRELEKMSGQEYKHVKLLILKLFKIMGQYERRQCEKDVNKEDRPSLA